ncbi:MAG: CdvA-like protein, partial [Candidatus Bathyarchaeia archaeon]
MRNLDLFLSIGKGVKDEYGRIIGEVVSLAAKPQGDIEFIYVKKADGTFARYSASNIVVNGPEVILVSNIKAETEMFCDRIPLIWRKTQALKELAEKNRIPPDLYDELQRSFECALDQLKSEAKNLLEKINMEVERCHKEIRELNYALVHLEVEHEIGQIDDQSYEIALSRIQDCLRRVNEEKTDLENMKSRLSS